MASLLLLLVAQVNAGDIDWSQCHSEGLRRAKEEGKPILLAVGDWA